MKTNILDFIDFGKVDTLLAGFNKSTGFVTAILDLDGNVLSKSGWRQICIEFHRINPETSKKCTISDTELAGKLAEGEKYHFYKCLNGLIDVAVPIVINGEHIANLFSGQFFIEEPDITFFKKQAKEFGFDEKKYLEALEEVPIVSMVNVKTAMDFLLNMTQIISELTFQKLEQTELNKHIRESEEEFKSVFESANVGKSITLLSGEINVNQSFCDMLGYTRAELQNKKWQDITPEEEIPAVQKILEPLLKGEKNSARFEKRYFCKSGSQIWADVSVSIRRDDKGKPLHFITTVIDITERRRLEEERKLSEELFSNAFHAGPAGMTITRIADGKFIDVNKAFLMMFEQNREEVIGHTSADLNMWTSEERGKLIQRQLEAGGLHNCELIAHSKTGKPVILLFSSEPMKVRGESCHITTMIDITERKRAEAEIIKANRMYAVISQINQMIIRIRDRDTLFAESCRIAVECGKFRMAWIGKLDEKTLTLMPIVWHGIEEGYLMKIKKISLRDVEEGRGPSGTAIREGKTTFCNDIENDPRMAPWRDEALRRGYRSSIALPISAQGKVIGAFSIYAPEPFYFNESEIKLLEEVTGDISFALETILTREKKEKAEEEAEKSSQLNSFLMKTIPFGIDIVDEEGNVLFVNEAMEKTVGGSWVGNKCWTVYKDDKRRCEQCPINYPIDIGVTKKLETTGVLGKRIIEISHTGMIYQDKKAVLEVFYDITERKRAELALRESEERFLRALENIPDVVVIYDTDLKIRYMNEATRRLTGRPTADFMGKREEEIWPPEVYRVYLPSLKEALNNRSITTLETGLLLPGGKLLNLVITCVPLFDEKGEVREVLGITQDLTERKRAEEVLKESEKKYRRIFENIQDVYYEASIDGTILEISPSIEIVSKGQYKQQDLIGKSMYDFYADAGERQTLLTILRDQGAVSDFEITLKNRNGSPLTCSISSKIFIDPDSHSQEIIGSMRDITERKRAEELLRESEERYRLLLEVSPVGIAVHSEGKLVFTNKAGAKIIGADNPEEVIGKPISEIVHPSNWNSSRERIRRMMAGEQGLYPVEDRYLRIDGREVPVQVMAVPLLYKSKPAVQVIVTDITELKIAEQAREKLEEQLRMSRKLEAIGSLAGGIAHDFNNLLSIILSFTGFALAGVPAGNPIQDDLLEVKKAGERAAVLTRQLLAFSRRQILQPKPIDLNQVITEIEKMLMRIIGEDIELAKVLAPELSVIMADSGQVEQVLMNLVINARDAMPTGGNLTIETANVEVDEEFAARHMLARPGSSVMLTVSDTGCGMDEQTKTRIFEPFFTTKEIGKGTGLGLSTVYGIVKQSGGGIWVYSEPGRGTTFKIYFPRAVMSDAQVSETPAAAAVEAGTETILVAEDEEAIRKIAARVLGAAGYTVLTASNGEEAIHISEEYKGKIHLLLTDVVMPRMDGKKLTDRLMSVRPGLKVLYMSGYPGDAIVHHGVLDMGTHFISKPFNEADLNRKVREALTG